MVKHIYIMYGYVVMMYDDIDNRKCNVGSTTLMHDH